MDLDLGSNGSECEVVGWSRKAPQTTQARSNVEKVTLTQMKMIMVLMNDDGDDKYTIGVWWWWW